MPILDGLEVLEDIRRRLPQPRIMISGHADIRTAMEAVQRARTTSGESSIPTSCCCAWRSCSSNKGAAPENTALPIGSAGGGGDATRFKMVGECAWRRAGGAPRAA
jgi:DNA-binding NtrC family response regulator